MSQYYYLNEQREPQGPHTPDELAAMMARGLVTPMTLVACVGGKAWEPLGTILSRENSEGGAPPPLPSGIGSCPSCGHLLAPTEEGKLPLFCSACGRALLPKTPGIWSNFLFALSNYAKFSGRATRKEFWSFMLITHALYLALLGGMMAGLASMFSFLFNTFKSIGLDKIQSLDGLSEEELSKEVDALLEPYMENVDWSSIEPTGLGLILIITCGLGLVVAALAFLIPSYAAITRRLHDRGWSGWWLLAYVIVCFFGGALGEIATRYGVDSVPGIINSFYSVGQTAFWIFLVILNLQDSQRGANQYGPSAKYPLG